MDILKELFGTSDELQINKSLFGGDSGSSTVDLGLGTLLILLTTPTFY